MTDRPMAKTRSSLIALALLAAVAATWGGGGAAYARRRREPQPVRNRLALRATPLPKPPTIDGRLAEGEWDHATSVALGLDLDAAQPITDGVVWKLAWDANTLYLAARTPLKFPTPLPGVKARDEDDVYQITMRSHSAHGRLDLRVGRDGVRSAVSDLFGVKDPNDEPPVRADAAVAERDGQLVLELAVPMTTLAHANRQRPGQVWRVRAVREYPGGAAVSMLCDRGAETDNWPTVTLAAGAVKARLEADGESLAAGRAEVSARLTALGKPVEGRFQAVLYRAGQWVGQAVTPIALDANATGEVSTRPDVDERLDPKASGECMATVSLASAAAGGEVFSLRLTWDADRMAPVVSGASRRWQNAPNRESAGRIEGRRGVRLVHTIEYDRGLRHGAERVYDANGNLRLLVPWQRGIIHGQRLVYHGDGQLMMSTPYSAGVADGNATRYDEKGRVVRTVGYRHGLRSGERVDWHVRRPERIAPYQQGLLDGVVRDYWDNGKLKMERPFREDILHGIEKHYNREGKLVDSRYWWNGERVSRRRYQAYAAGAAAE